MKTVLWGKVTQQHLDDAELFAGITVTERVKPESVPVDPMVKGEPGILQRNWRLALYNEALICVGRNDHLVHAFDRCKVPVYCVEK